ncbi:tRNA (adenosine(37)-N6)-threonylcarbamoyltransferase complex transferase subunit TsaD [Acetobacteraceae bacterium]|nr:tRNA (adenosine(37)-N6)-threonylcarbamoyltransferase complex transferase subunit TsaD [Acetobacteraceae bacterium]
MQSSSASLSNTPYILAIESSCDDTACAVLAEDGTVLSHLTKTQIEHLPLGGVVPELAARAHLQACAPLIEETLLKANVSLEDFHFIAATIGPGLIGGLLTGNGIARGLSLSTKIPFIGVNHIEAHILSPLFDLKQEKKSALLTHNKDCFPYLAFLFSGGHCQCVLVEEIGTYTPLGGTIDDSIGEAFDKVAKMLGLGWPGGPQIEKLAKLGNPAFFSLPRPLKGREGCDFSFSGLKTAVSKLIEPYNNTALPLSLVQNIAASFQKAVTDIVEDRARNALKIALEKNNLKFIATGGGVACNSAIRKSLEKIVEEHDLTFLAAPKNLCPDNAIMIGWAALLRQKWHATPSSFNDIPRPRWPLKEMKILQNTPE